MIREEIQNIVNGTLPSFLIFWYSKDDTNRPKTMKSPLPREAYRKNAVIYKILANPKRLEILNLLKKGEMGVETLLRVMKVSKANLSQHLAVMRRHGLITPRRAGLNIFYKIVDPRIVDPCKILHDLRRRKIIS